ncbi:MAG: short-chain dehydrogenase [Gammaproteobacteria bacterium]|nr:short-chain dehydrogenase [Gammaproteobacteria bacterium]MCH2351063.1 SDR family oxidoreductase [Pseudomonadales bacterium]HAO54211.1 short-chain dehydrogenase [Gammaproteobacteria bacterium]
MGQLQGKVAVITGGTSGIGEATAELFVAQGAQVVLTGRSEEKGQLLASRLGQSAIYVAADVTKEEDIKLAIDQAIERFGRLDVLFNNAGGPTAGNLDDITREEINYGVDLLLTSTILGIRYAIEPMKIAGGGSIINNSSIAGLRYRQGNGLYSALKAAVTHYTRLAGVELGPHGIRVNAISPGAIATPIFWGGSGRANTLSDEDNARKMEKLKGNLAKATPIPRSGIAEDIANAALFLASDAGSYINSHDLVVDGGRTAMFNE